MRITHYLHHMWASEGGVWRAVLDLCRYQARAGADVTLATFDPRDVPKEWNAGGAGLPRVRVLPPHGKLRGVVGSGLRTRLAPVVAACDVLHLHNIWDPVQVSLTRAAREIGKPYVQTPHGMLADWSVRQKALKKSVFFAMFVKRVLGGAAFVHLTAQAELDQSAKRHPRTPGRVVPLVFDVDAYRADPDPSAARRELSLAEGPAILYLSRLHEKKRPDLVIEAAARLKGIDFTVLMAGPGDPEYRAGLERLAARLGVGDRVRFLGMVPEGLKSSLFAACDVFVLPTQMENFGFVYFESLACGTPLVTTRGTDTWRELEESGGGTIVGNPTTTAEELAGTLSRLLADRAKLKEMGRAGRRWVLSHLDPARIVPEYFRMYEAAIAGRGAP